MNKISELPGLDRIRDRFLDLLSERMEDLESLTFEGDQYETATSLREAQNILHKIAGSAGTLGFSEFGETARDWENRIISYFETGQPDVDQIFRGMAVVAEEAETLLASRAKLVSRA